MYRTFGELLGEGSYGKVYECLYEDGSVCAAKVVSLRKGASPDARVEIEKEVELLRSMSHPNIVRFLGTDHDQDSLFIFLELMPCGSISCLLRKFGPFKDPTLRKFTREMLNGLQYLHSQSIIHRDVKGQNVLVDHTGTCKLSDFGCSRRLLGRVAEATSLKGTPRFMAPEVILSRKGGGACAGYTFKADIWSALHRPAPVSTAPPSQSAAYAPSLLQPTTRAESPPAQQPTKARAARRRPARDSGPAGRSLGCTVVEMATGAAPWPRFSIDEAVMFHVAARPTARPETPTGLAPPVADLLDRVRGPQARALQCLERAAVAFESSPSA